MLEAVNPPPVLLRQHCRAAPGCAHERVASAAPQAPQVPSVGTCNRDQAMPAAAPSPAGSNALTFASCSALIACACQVRPRRHHRRFTCCGISCSRASWSPGILWWQRPIGGRACSSSGPARGTWATPAAGRLAGCREGKLPAAHAGIGAPGRQAGGGAGWSFSWDPWTTNSSLSLRQHHSFSVRGRFWKVRHAPSGGGGGHRQICRRMGFCG